MPTEYDEHGQPRNRAFCAARVTGRSLDEFIGLCKGIAADGNIVQEEAEFLLNWLEANPSIAGEWPGSIIAARIYEALRDGILDQKEKKELYDLINKSTGTEPLKQIAKNLSTQLPPLPRLRWWAGLHKGHGGEDERQVIPAVEKVYRLGGAGFKPTPTEKFLNSDKHSFN